MFGLLCVMEAHIWASFGMEAHIWASNHIDVSGSLIGLNLCRRGKHIGNNGKHIGNNDKHIGAH